jgi:hypothetical protein
MYYNKLVLRTLTAVQVGKGVAAALAAAWAKSHLAAGEAVLTQAVGKHFHDEESVSNAIESLKTWANAQP